MLASTGWTCAAAAVAVSLRQRRIVGAERETVVRAAHELRGALTTISLAAQASDRHRDLDRAVAVALERGCAALSDLDGGADQTRPSVECFVAHRLLDDCVAAARPLADAHGVSLVAHWEGAPALVVGEQARLAQALTNLIANAIEHGGGAVTVNGRSGDGRVRIEVSDEGPGLPASIAVLSRRARQGVGRRGRGLAIAHDVAARHDGAVVATRPTRTGGARLALVLPEA